MFIPYELLGNFIYKFYKNDKLKTFFYNKKIEQNVKYIEHNKRFVINKLRKKYTLKEKINVIFYVYDETKWKCNFLYQEFNNDSRFNVKILVTRNAAKNSDNPSYQSIEDVKKVYKYFKDKNYNVELAYDILREKFIPLKKFSPDIIFYQHPWYVETSQGPVVCSKFALTAYIPYYFPIETADIDVNLRFHKYVEKYYILNQYTKKSYEKRLGKPIKNLVVVGYPYLDYFYKNKILDGEYIIYAPHWTVANKGLSYGTFEWSGKFLLDFALAHPNLKWIFKPHPMLFKALVDNNIMTLDEVNLYYEKWGKIGIKYESGDYLDLFNKSRLMITDCSSFLGEYFVTGKPLIHMMSKDSQFRDSNNPILKTFYRVENLNELKYALEKLLHPNFIEEETTKCLRTQTLNDLNLLENSASKNILDDIFQTISLVK